MAFVVKFAKTIRNNWKKSVFFTAVAIYGADYGKKRYEESLLRTAYCLEAKKYGESPCRTGERPRKVTVFLNPAAQNGKAKKLFDKNVGPVLYLAGLEVTVVKTEYEGQAKKYMDVIDSTVDAIVVAGGDGTLLEVVTGLLRREDEATMSRIPVGVVPLGSTNTLAQALFHQGESPVRWMLESAISVVKNITRPTDVMHIKAPEGKSVFALNSLDWGIYRDAEAKKAKYWYFRSMKHQFTYLRQAMREWPPTLRAKLSYTRPCSGCNRCYVAPPVPQWRWWHIFLPPKIEVPKKDYSEIVNKECGQEHDQDLVSMEFACKTCNSRSDQEDNSIHLRIGPEHQTKTEFIKEGWRRKHEDVDAAADSQHIQASKITLDPIFVEGQETFFTIDNEQYEAMPIEIELLKEKLQVFCGPDTPTIS